MSYGTLICGCGHVPDQLRAAAIGGGWEVDMDAMAGQDAGGLDL